MREAPHKLLKHLTVLPGSTLYKVSQSILNEFLWEAPPEVLCEAPFRGAPYIHTHISKNHKNVNLHEP